MEGKRAREAETEAGWRSNVGFRNRKDQKGLWENPMISPWHHDISIFGENHNVMLCWLAHHFWLLSEKDCELSREAKKVRELLVDSSSLGEITAWGDHRDSGLLCNRLIWTIWKGGLFFCVFFPPFFWISVSLLLSFSAFPCFCSFIVLCFSASLLLRLSTVLPLCFSAFPCFFLLFQLLCFSASSSKMLQVQPKCCKSYSQWEVPTPKCCKDSWNGSFQLQNAANSMENGHNKRTPKNAQNEKTVPKRILDPFGNIWNTFEQFSRRKLNTAQFLTSQVDNERCHHPTSPVGLWNSEVKSCHDDPWTRGAKLIFRARPFGRVEHVWTKKSSEWAKSAVNLLQELLRPPATAKQRFRQAPGPLSLLTLESYVLFAKDEKKRVAEQEERPQVGSRSGRFGWGRHAGHWLTSLSRLEETRGTAKEYQDWKSLQMTRMHRPKPLSRWGLLQFFRV